jgi:hypothetical protein
MTNTQKHSRLFEAISGFKLSAVRTVFARISNFSVMLDLKDAQEENRENDRYPVSLK